MTRPGALLALWNGVADGFPLDEYEDWHAFEHVPERVGLPGFVEARRYRHRHAGGTRYFTCYWLESLQALDTPGYRDLLANPTPWSARMRAALTDFVRLPCVLDGIDGCATAPLVVPVVTAGAVAQPAGALDAACAQLVREAAVACVQRATVRSGEKHPLDKSGAAPASGRLLVVQGADRGRLDGAVRALARLAPWSDGTGSAPAVFELVTIVRQQDLQHPLGARQPPRPDLFRRYQSPGDPP